MKATFPILCAVMAISLSGCGALNSWTAGVENNAAADYVGARANIQKADDMALQLVADSACAVKLGALSRAGATNPAVVSGILKLCPIPNPDKTLTGTTDMKAVTALTP